MEHKVIRTSEDLGKISADWEQLHERAGRLPFTSFNWAHLWWKHFGEKDGWELYVICGYEGAQLVGVLPLAIIKRNGIRVMEWAGSDICDYCDVLAQNEACAKELWKIAHKNAPYDCAILRDVHPDALTHASIGPFAKKQGKNIARILKVQYSSGEEWFSQLNKHTRSEFRRHKKLLMRKGAVSFETKWPAEVPLATIDKFIQHKMDWAVTLNKPGIFRQDEVFPFFHELIEKGMEKKSILLSCLNCNEHCVAMSLQLIYKNSVYGYMAAYDPEWAVCSPGKLEIVKLIMATIDAKYDAFDLLRGEERYKHRYTNTTAELYEYTFCRTLRGWLHMLTRCFVNKARRVRKMGNGAKKRHKKS